MSARELPPRLAGLAPALPSSWYVAERVFELEKERIFCREWLCAGREEELPEPGAWRLLDICGESLILVRNRDGRLRAFYNVCRHRGTRLCREPGAVAADGLPLPGGIAAGRITCPYHGWTYDFDGRLIAAPYLSGGSETAFEKAHFSLYPVAVESWGGFVFLNLTPAAAVPLLQQLAAIPGRLERYPLAALRIARTLRYEVAANWKVLCENYNECYHCAGVHPQLCEVVPAFGERGGANLDWVRGIPHRPGAYTFTASGTTRRRAFPTLNEDERVRHKGELVYPNLFLSLACDHVAVFILLPRGAAHTSIVCHFLFEPFEMAKPDFDPGDAAEFWDLVNRQDWAICAAVQQGVSSRVHQRGYYAPMEDFSLDIRRYVLEKIGDAVDAT